MLYVRIKIMYVLALNTALITNGLFFLRLLSTTCPCGLIPTQGTPSCWLLQQYTKLT